MVIGVKEIELYFLLFRVVEIQRICETTATPFEEGANLSERSNNKRIYLSMKIGDPLRRIFFLYGQEINQEKI